MTDLPLVSVCVPCYNAGKFVGQALDSVLGQTYPNIEVIAVNDGSKDSSAEVLESYRSRGVKVVHQENRGQCAAANRAFAESRGEYIKYFDADDLLSSNFIDEQVKSLKGHTDSVASAKWGRFYKNDPATHRIESEPALWSDLDPADWLVQSWINARSMMQCGLWLIPRQVIERVGGWDESLTLNNDFEFFARVLCGVRKVLYCADAVLYYRSGTPGCLSSSNSRKAYESHCRTLLMGTGHLLKRRTDARARLAVANTCQQGVYDFYPHKDLCRQMEQRISECGGAHLRPAGGRVFQALSIVMGWKLAKRLTLALARSRS